VIYGQDNVSLRDDVERGGERDEKPEKEPQEQNPLIKTDDLEAGYHRERENKASDNGFRQYVSFQAYNDNKYKEKKNFDPGVEPLEIAVSRSSFPMDITGSYDLSQTVYAFFKKRYFQSAPARCERFRRRAFQQK
jgi:hypothetical protein